MTTIDPDIAHIHHLLKFNVDRAYLEKARVFIPSGKTILGVRVPKIRELANAFHKKRKPDVVDLLKTVDRIFERQIRDEILFGIFLLQKQKKHYSKTLFGKIDRWIENIENWETCDQLATIAADVVAKNNDLFRELEKWTRSDNLWRRRFVLATGSALNHGGRSYVPEVLELCQNLMMDREKMVAKAIPWTLRETSKKDEAKVYEFLMQWKGKIKKGTLKSSAAKLSGHLRDNLLN